MYITRVYISARVYVRDENHVCVVEGRCVFVLESAGASVRIALEKYPELAVRIVMSCFEARFNFARMMRVIVENGHAVLFADFFEASAREVVVRKVFSAFVYGDSEYFMC